MSIRCKLIRQSKLNIFIIPTGSSISLVALSYRDLRTLHGPFQINDGLLKSHTVNTVTKSGNIILCDYPRVA